MSSDRDVVPTELTREVLAASNVGTWDWDIATDTVHCNGVTAALFNVPDALKGEGIPLRRFEEAIHPEDREKFQHLLEASCRDGGLFVAEYRTSPGPGQICWVLARGSFELDAVGQPQRGRGVVVDITQSRLDQTRPDRPYFINQPAENSPALQRVADRTLAAWESAQHLRSDRLRRLTPLMERLLFQIGRELADDLNDPFVETDRSENSRLH